jgi:hypothetical protein
MKRAVFEHMGNNGHRLNIYDPYNEQEIAFVAEINKELKYNSRMLDFIFDSTGKTFIGIEREEMAITIIQWLGTPVGQSFRANVQKRIDNKNADLVEDKKLYFI